MKGNLALKKNEMKDLVSLSSGVFSIFGNYVFKIKRKSDKFIGHYKAMLRAKGFLQKSEVEFDRLKN